MCLMAKEAFIQCRVSTATKAAVRAAAERQQLTESALLKRLVEVLLQTSGSSVPESPVSESRPVRSARLSVRLEPGDWALLQERATGRGMPAATYLSNLVRSHLRALSPLPKAELLALKQSVAALNAIGRNLNQIARLGQQGGRVVGPGRDDLRAMLKICEALRDHVRGLIKANVISWQVGHDDKQK